MSDSTPVKNRLIPAGVQMTGAWLVNDGCDFVKFVKWCLVPRILPHMVVMYLRMTGLKSEGGMRRGCMSVPRAVLAALSTRSLPRMPTWPGSQQR